MSRYGPFLIWHVIIICYMAVIAMLRNIARAIGF